MALAAVSWRASKLCSGRGSWLHLTTADQLHFYAVRYQLGEPVQGLVFTASDCLPHTLLNAFPGPPFRSPYKVTP